MEFSPEELELESLEVKESNIRLSSSATKCTVCKIGNVVKVGRETQLVIYTRSGTKKGVHVEMRCNNRCLQLPRSGSLKYNISIKKLVCTLFLELRFTAVTSNIFI